MANEHAESGFMERTLTIEARGPLHRLGDAFRPERPKRVVYKCILGDDCSCAQQFGELDQFCANSRRFEVEER